MRYPNDKKHRRRSVRLSALAVLLLVTATLGISAQAMLQGGQLQPGTGIVSGTLKSEDGRPASGVRVGVVEVDDSSASLVSVTETDKAGRYQLMNVPAGRYHVVAGRLSDLHYFPEGRDRSTAGVINVEAARIRSDVNFAVPAGSSRPPASGPVVRVVNTPSAEDLAYQRIVSETNPDRKAPLVSAFAKNYPRSAHLTEAYVSLMKLCAPRNDRLCTIDYADKAVKAGPENINTLLAVSRTYAELAGYMDQALVHAEHAAALALRLKNQPVPKGMNAMTWTDWVNAINSSALSNLEWVKKMDAWQRKRLLSLVTPRRR